MDGSALVEGLRQDEIAYLPSQGTICRRPMAVLRHGLDAGRRALARCAVAYFCELDDARPDSVDDDERVVQAVRTAVHAGQPAAGG